MTEIKCTCKIFEPNYELLDAYVNLLVNMGHTFFPLEFDYCPWCGKKLIKPKREPIGVLKGDKMSLSESILKDPKKVLINKRPVKFHVVNKTVIFDEPIATQDGDKIEMEIVLNEDGTQVVKSVFLCS